MSLVLKEESGGVCKLTLNDPANLNAMSEAMADEFSSVIGALRKAPPRAIILTGAGRAFSAGGDLNMLEKKRELSKDENRSRMLKFYRSFLGMRGLSVPLIAAINGHAIGAGLCVASACDIRVAGRGAKLGFTFTRLGLHPGMGATYFLPQAIGYARASELLLTARVIDADAALGYGLVSKVVEPEKVVEEAAQIAAEIIECGPESVRNLLSSLRGDEAALDAALEREAKFQGESYASAEFAEGVRAAIEKRKARF